MHDIQYATAPIRQMVEQKNMHDDDASGYGCLFGLGDTENKKQKVYFLYFSDLYAIQYLTRYLILNILGVFFLNKRRRHFNNH